MARILFVTERYFPELGGLARSSDRISRALASLGHEVNVFCLEPELESGQAKSDTLAPGLICHRFGRSKQLDFTLQQSMIFLEWLDQSNSRPFDLVWSHYAATNGFLGTWFARNHNKVSVLSVRGNDVDRQLFPPGDLSRLQWCLQNATCTVAVSEDLAKKVRTLAGTAVRVLPNSVDGNIFCPGPADPALKQQYDIRPDHLVLAFSGEVRAKKGWPMLLECFRQLSLRRPTKLLIIGDVRGKEQTRFQNSLAQSPQFRDQVICTGHLPDLAQVAAHLRLADAFVLPSLWDGMPNSLLEAMACQIPVFTSDAGAIPEVVRNRQNGVMVPRTHLHLLASHIEAHFSKAAAEREGMLRQGRQEMLDGFSADQERQRLQALLQDLLPESGQ